VSESATKDEKIMRMVCKDPRHERPCPLPCEACNEECDPNCKSPLEFDA